VQVDVEAVNALLATLEEEAAFIVSELVPRDSCSVDVTVSTRYRGQGHELQIALAAARLNGDAHAVLRERFEAAYLARLGRLVPRVPLEVPDFPACKVRTALWHVPLNGRQRGLKFVRETGQRHVDDSRIKLCKQRAECVDGRNSPDQWIAPLALCRAQNSPSRRTRPK